MSVSKINPRAFKDRRCLDQPKQQKAKIERRRGREKRRCFKKPAVASGRLMAIYLSSGRETAETELGLGQ